MVMDVLVNDPTRGYANAAWRRMNEYYRHSLLQGAAEVIAYGTAVKFVSDK